MVVQIMVVQIVVVQIVMVQNRGDARCNKNCEIVMEMSEIMAS